MLLQTEYNEVVVLQQGGDSSVHNRWLMGKVIDTRKFVKKSKHRDIDIMENEENEKKNGSESAVQERTFNYFARPQPNVLNLF